MFPRLALALVLMLSIAYAPRAYAQALSPEVKKYLAAARALYESLAYEEALAQVAKAEKAAQGSRDDVAVNLLKGVLLREMGKVEQAENAFRTALALEPLAGLPVTASPTLKAQFEKLRKKMSKERALEAPAPEKREKPPPVVPPTVKESPPPKDVTVEPPKDAPLNETKAEAVADPPPAVVEEQEPPPDRGRSLAIAGTTVGAVMLAAGGVAMTYSVLTVNALKRGDTRAFPTVNAATSAWNGAFWAELAGWPLLVGGAGTLATSLLLWPKNAADEDEEEEEDVSASFIIGNGGALFGVRGRF